jgi:hypothetical protein
MADEVHPVVELLIARTESHPEEFRDDYLMSEVRPTVGSGRWFRVIHAIRDHGLKQDAEALNVALSKIRMQQIYEWMMDELINGEDRRREEEEDKKRLWLQQQQLHQQAYQTSPHLQSPHLQAGTGTLNLSQLGSYQQSAMLGAASSIPAQPRLGEDSLVQQLMKRIGK